MNQEEASQVVEYINSFFDELTSDGKTCAIMTPFRPQSLLIKNTLTENEDIDIKIKETFTNAEIGSLDDFASRNFDVVVVSVCKTENAETTGGPLLNNSLNIEYLKSRANKKIVIIGKASGLNTIWKKEFLDIAKS